MIYKVFASLLLRLLGLRCAEPTRGRRTPGEIQSRFSESRAFPTTDATTINNYIPQGAPSVQLLQESNHFTAKPDTRSTNEVMMRGITGIYTFLLLLCLLQLSLARRTRLTLVDGVYNGEEMISKHFGAVAFKPSPRREREEWMRGGTGVMKQQDVSQSQHLIGCIEKEVESLVEHLREAIAMVGPHGCVIHIAHSHGAIITALASQQLAPEEMRQIEILSFGGAAAIRTTPQTPFRRCVNYYSINDPVLPVVPQAIEALRSGRVYADEFIFLAPRTGDPIADHSLVGATYDTALQWEGIRYKHKHQSMVSRTLRPLFLLFLSIFRFLYTKFHQSVLEACAPYLFL
jgi:hypothetical protein